ncbi:EamA family transporter RarD [Lacibacterium aquatile]|uniref:EamA family transporter RarD n=1 Tax=Lacibacterium aquatile TaxID=1168082 RepID=A0ABW5DZ16_9PROT
MPSTPETSRGYLFAAIAFGSWGFAPLYFRMMGHFPAGEMLAHRILWSGVALIVLVLAFQRIEAFKAIFNDRKLVLRMLFSGVLIACNWGLYLWAVVNGHVLESSLGYYINPLFNVALGALILKERLSGRRKIAIGVAGVGVIAMLAGGGNYLWISLLLASSFSVYGLVRKMTPVDPLTGLLFETMLSAPFAFAYLAYVSAQTGQVSGTADSFVMVLLLGTSLVTTIPLLAFNAAAKRLDYATLGICQYLSPSLQFLLAVTVFGEAFTYGHALAFGCIWIGLALYTSDIIRQARTQKL